jgi:hypothetical protein
MGNGWTPERKARQRAAIYRWRPWDRSSGPKSAEGKATVSRNAWKHGHRSAAFLAEISKLRDLLDQL